MQSEQKLRKVEFCRLVDMCDRKLHLHMAIDS